MQTNEFYCPLNSINCPYRWKDNGTCAMIDEGWDPHEECKNLAAYEEEVLLQEITDFFEWLEEEDDET